MPSAKCLNGRNCSILRNRTPQDGDRARFSSSWVLANVCGGGVAGQADAVRLGITRALMVFNAEFRAKLKAEGLVTRDPRAKERKKYGQKGARKRFQFSKR